MNNKIEFRSYSSELNVESRKISGLAIPVESRSQLIAGKFYETISRDAVSQNLILNNDVRLLVDHEPTRGSLGRSKYGEGTLKLTVTERGLEFDINLPETSFGEETLDAVKRGDIDALSFGFYVGKDEWHKNTDGAFERRILDIDKLIEISLLDIAPAYTATEVTMRSLEDFKRSLEEEPKEEDPTEKKKEDDDTDNDGDNTGNDDSISADDDKEDVKELEEKQAEEKQAKINEKLDNLVAEFNSLATID